MSENLHPAYRPDIDGLRAVAVMAVVIFHAFPSILTGGFVGVDVFFVISGFLISSIVFKTLDKGKFSFVDFYSRRIRRIFPALILVLLTAGGLGWLLLLPDEFKAVGKHMAAGVLFVSNFQLWREAGYFDVASELKPLLHLWSLAIEEQFYLLWPLLMFLAHGNRARLLLVVILAAAASMFLCVSSLYGQTEQFYFPQTRFWELLSGSILAFLTLYHPKWLDAVFSARLWGGASGSVIAVHGRALDHAKSVCGFLLIALAMLTFNQETPFPGWRALLPVGGAFLLIAAGPQAWLNRYILSSKIMVFIGLVSFPLYLWHWPLLAFLRIVESGNASGALRGGAVVLSMVLSWLTYRLVEKPLRFRGNKTALTLFAVSLATGAVGYSCHVGLVVPRSASSLGVDKIVAAAGSFEFPSPKLGVLQYKGADFLRQGDAPDKVLYWGDSNMEQYWPRIDEVLMRQPENSRGAIFATHGGCLPIRNVRPHDDRGCAIFTEAAFDFALNDPAIKTVVIGAQWFSYFYGTGRVYEEGDETYILEYYDSVGALKAYAKLEETILSLRSKGKTVYLLLNIPIGSEMDPKQFVHRSLKDFGFSIAENAISRSRHEEMMGPISATLIAISERHGAIVLNPASLICDQDSCRSIADDGWPIYKDSEHWNSHFVRRYADFMDQTILEK